MDKPAALLVKVTSEEENIRLDRLIARHCPHLGFAETQKIIRSGQVRVNGKRAKASERLQVDAEVRLPPQIVKKTSMKTEKPFFYLSAGNRQMLEESILHEDEQILILNKPAGLAVQGGSGQSVHLDGLLQAWGAVKQQRFYLVHRLDKETSGVFVVAKSPSVAAKLAEGFRLKETKKEYWALVAGMPLQKQGIIDLPLRKREQGGGEQVVVDYEEGKQAITQYAVLDKVGKTMSWLALQPLQGRTHQLRVHCAAMEMPIVGDAKYGAPVPEIAALGVETKKLYLHARTITFMHPHKNKPVQFTAPLPPHFKATWQLLNWKVV